MTSFPGLRSGSGARLFADYAEAHRTPGNRACHAAGIPLIVFAVVLALATVRLGGGWTAAEPVIAAVGLLEIALDPPAGVVFLIFSAASEASGRFLIVRRGAVGALPVAAALFILGWGFQFVGHALFEKNRPAFVRNLRHLLIGPLWMARKALPGRH